MPVCGHSLSRWTFSLLCCLLQHRGPVSSTQVTLSPPLAPSLRVTSRAGGTVVLTCTIPPKRPLGVKFELHTRQGPLDTVMPQTKKAKAQFTVKLFTKPLCCLYWDENNISPFSMFVYPDDPVHSPDPPRTLPSPILSVAPPQWPGEARPKPDLPLLLTPRLNDQLAPGLRPPEDTQRDHRGVWRLLVAPQASWVSTGPVRLFQPGAGAGSRGGVLYVSLPGYYPPEGPDPTPV
ncbi:uncharacterized protein LOC134008873 [Osmerus eperlanus]|uniref:uncharacterized protein LOC134008873 n=1 Tax=Osmerus eperlanus TaxID=29151 RepID=UPI002E107BCA